MAELPDGSVDLILTSPPFLALRSYLPADHPDKAKEIGSEATPAEFVDTLLRLTAEWRRLLAPHGSLCVELGDTYSGAGGYGSPDSPNPAYGNGERFGERWEGRTAKRFKKKDDGWPEAKSLSLTPEAYRFALAYGTNPHTGQESPAGRWRVRNVIRWVRPNPPVGALGDKFRPATSEMVVACVSGSRYFDLDAVREAPSSGEAGATTGGSRQNGGFRGVTQGGVDHPVTVSHPAGAPPLDWWKLSPGGYPGSHYAVWPPELCVKPIKAMSPERVCTVCGEPSRRVTESERLIDGEPSVANISGRSAAEPWREDVSQRTIGGASFGKRVTTLGWSDCGHDNWRSGLVLDPFAGSGTTLLVATGHGRDAIGIDLDGRNAVLARERIGGLFLEVVA
jgi:hypothetical protein